MKRLPRVDDLINLIHVKTAEATESEEKQQVKVATQSFVVPAAAELHKIAQRLREYDATEVTYTDVQTFAEQLMGVQ